MVVGAWVLSGLSDLQADDFLHRVLEWLVPEGHFVFREACGFHEDTRPSNSTLPRSPVFYCQMLHSVTTKSSSFTILRATSLQSYVTHEGDPTKLCFLAQRSEVNSRTRHAVDIRYSKSFILRMERLLGHTWLSTGGESTTRKGIMYWTLVDNIGHSEKQTEKKYISLPVDLTGILRLPLG
ncbi:uncharacterized protein LOC134773937 [Penaeus indicus]|uniref:uncharacterized protein LOC134773937 n=1 Tax=Penaeus indicus TaxID=29960 RepID=UPI00300C064E